MPKWVKIYLRCLDVFTLETCAEAGLTTLNGSKVMVEGRGYIYGTPCK